MFSSALYKDIAELYSFFKCWYLGARCIILKFKLEINDVLELKNKSIKNFKI